MTDGGAFGTSPPGANEDLTMAFSCDLCGKRPSSGNTVSHANNKSRRRFLPNLKSVRANVSGRVRKLRVCTQCIRSGKVTKVA